MVIIHTDQAIPEICYICFTPNTTNIPAKLSHDHDIVSVHFNNFYCTEICDKLNRDLAMLTYISLNMDDC